MAARDLATVLVGAGLVAAGLLLVAGGLPTYTTEVAATAPDTRSLADQTGQSSPVNVDPIPDSALSPAEQTAVRDARQSPGEAASGPAAVDAGSTFDYRNDVTNEYVVTVGEEVHLVRVVTEVRYGEIGLGLAAVVLGGLLVVLGAWNARSR